MALVILNFKAYSEAIGENAVKLAEIAKEVADQTNTRVMIAPQTADIHRVSEIVETVAQHIDPAEPGACTGSSLTETAKQAGAVGSLLNHAERRISLEEVEKGINKLRTLRMLSVVCAEDIKSSKQIAAFNPDYIAIEPPELIGSGIPVSSAKPEIVEDGVKSIKEINNEIKVLCGAGISSGEDVKKAIELGAEGVLLASAFVKSEDPKKLLEDICGGLNK